MDKILKVLNGLNTQLYRIHSDIDLYVNNILDWTIEVENSIGRQCITKKEVSTFLLPKAPSEKKSKNRRKKNSFEIDVNSAINSTLNANEISNINRLVPRFTRKTRKGNTSNISQLNALVEKESIMTADIKKEASELKENKSYLTNDTFVVSEASSTRTKPIVGKKNSDQEVLGVNKNKSPKASIKYQSSERHALENESEVLSRKSVEIQKGKTISSVESPVSEKSNTLFYRTESRSPIKRITRKSEFEKTIADNIEKPIRKKNSRTLSESPLKRPTKFSKTFCRETVGSTEKATEIPDVDYTKISEFAPRNIKSSCSVRSESVRFSLHSTFKDTNIQQEDTNNEKTDTKSLVSHLDGDKTYAVNNDSINIENCTINSKILTVSAETPLKAIVSTFVIDKNVDEMEFLKECNEKSPLILKETFTKINVTSTPTQKNEKIHEDKFVEMFKIVKTDSQLNRNEEIENSLFENETKKEEGNSVSKKKKMKKKEEKTETTGDFSDTGRITRTKSKAIQEMQKENDKVRQQNKQKDISVFAKKLLTKAKKTSIKKMKMTEIMEHFGTPKSGCVSDTEKLCSTNMVSNAKYKIFLDSSKKEKTPLITLHNSTLKMPKIVKQKVIGRDSSVENLAASATNIAKVFKSENKLKSKKYKEDEAAKKRENVIKIKQQELKRKNELKHQLAMKQREKIEQEKYNNMIRSEKEKEERHKLILQERQMKIKEEVMKKKILTQQKIAETVERRRLEEEARLAKLKEMEAEEQRLAKEKQKEQERLEKREQERLALKKAREEYEVQQRLELEAEKMSTKKLLPSASKMQSCSKRPKIGLSEKKDWDYKARNANDYGLEYENSEIESDDEKAHSESSDRPFPPWVSRVKNCQSTMLKCITIEMLGEYMPCYQKTPDIQRMFNMTPTRKIKRNSSAIWNTPSS